MIRSRTGLMLASARVAMALLFAIWVWIDPPHPVFATTWAGLLFACYALMALAALAVALRSWWFEHRLAPAAFAIDALMFLAGLYATAAVALDLFSVFITFFALLVLTAAARWNERIAVVVAAALVLCFLLAGVLVLGRGQPLDVSKFLRRLAYLGVLAALLVWFARSRPGWSAPRLSASSSAANGDPLQDALVYAMTTYAATSGLAAWREEGEVRPRVVVSAGAAPSVRSFDLGAAPFLFQRDHGRRLELHAGKRLMARANVGRDPLIDAFDVCEGLAIPFAARTGHGVVLLGGIKGLCADDVFGAPAIASEVGRAIDDESTQAMAREVAMSRLRAALAADLHDGVAQTLAGVQFRLTALAGRIASGSATAADAESIGTGIATEQSRLRDMIEHLRLGTITPGRRDVRQELLSVIGPLAEQWQVAIALSEAGEPLLLSTTVIYQVQQIVREAVANAVRHGKATSIGIDLSPGPSGGFVLEICDNGRGSMAPGDARPRSIAERTAALGGTLVFASHPGKTSVLIAISGAPA